MDGEGQRIIGNYNLVRCLGQGGMGVVYLAEHALIGSRVAVKILQAEFSRDPDIVNRFFNEARSAGLLSHPGLVSIFDYGTELDGTAYLVMEYLEGENLGDRLKREHRLPADEAIALARQIASAVGAAHARGIVHRDLKPDNIFLVPDPDASHGVRAKVLDFGIAKLTARNGSMRTRTGVVMGTPTYMSPEQCRGAGQVDQRADIYSLACLLYEMLVGRPPFVGEGPGEVVAKHIYEPPPPARLHDRSIHPGLDQLLLRALAKNPQERPQSMDELASELAAVPGAGRSSTAPRRRLPSVPHLPAPASASAPPARSVTTLGSAAAERVDRAPIRRRLVVPAAATALLAMVVGGAVLWGDRERTQAAGSAAAVAPPAPAAEPAARPGAEELLAGSDLGAGALAAPAGAIAAKAVVVPTVRLRIDSLPPGAEVFRPDGQRVGVTPIVEDVPVAPGRATYMVKLAGYRDARVDLPTDQHGHTYVGLKRARTERKAAPTKKRR